MQLWELLQQNISFDWYTCRKSRPHFLAQHSKLSITPGKRSSPAEEKSIFNCSRSSHKCWILLASLQRKFGSNNRTLMLQKNFQLFRTSKQSWLEHFWCSAYIKLIARDSKVFDKLFKPLHVFILGYIKTWKPLNFVDWVLPFKGKGTWKWKKIIFFFVGYFWILGWVLLTIFLENFCSTIFCRKWG